MRFASLFSSLLLGMLIMPTFAGESDGKSFAVLGEQVDHQIPNGWKLAWMDGQVDGRYLMEFIPADEDIKAWRSGYLAIERIPLPSTEAMEEVRQMKTSLAEVGLHYFINQAESRCGGRHEEMSRRVNTFNGILFAVSGGFCSRYGATAPFGEGAFVAFLEGQQNIFRIQYAWRPASEADGNLHLPWRISPDKAGAYLNAIKATTLCGAENQPVCQINYQ